MRAASLVRAGQVFDLAHVLANTLRVADHLADRLR